MIKLNELLKVNDTWWVANAVLSNSIKRDQFVKRTMSGYTITYKGNLEESND